RPGSVRVLREAVLSRLLSRVLPALWRGGPLRTDWRKRESRAAMNKSRAFIPGRLRPWIEARSGLSLSHVHLQMARELGMNTNKLGKLAKHRQEPWKLPLPDFIARIYIKRFGKMPDVVKTVEEVAAAEMAKRDARRLRKRAATGDPGSS